MSIELKIKSKHLSVEAQIIRYEEQKLKKQMRWIINQHTATGSNEPAKLHMFAPYNSYCSLNSHRRWDVRNENRATYLARAYIAGVPYNTVESKRKPENEFTFVTYIIPRVVAMVAKYGDNKMSTKIYDKVGRVMVDNPAIAKLNSDILSWSTTSEASISTLVQSRYSQNQRSKFVGWILQQIQVSKPWS